jgi:hypothetical protein
VLKFRIDKRVRYEGNGDISPPGPPNYFQKLFTKYEKEDCPDWLREYFPDDAVRVELVYLRKEALYYAIEAAKLEVRTSRGWHHKRNVGELRILGGKLARLKTQDAAEPEIAQVESEIRIQRSRRSSARAKVEELLELSQYRGDTVIFTATEYLRSPGRYVLLPSDVIQGVCRWLSIPELGVFCTPETIRSARRHFSIDRRNENSYRVYQWQLPRSAKGENASGTQEDPTWDERVFMTSPFICHCCECWMTGKEIGPHLVRDERIPVKLIAVNEERDELYRTDTNKLVASWAEKKLKV